MLRLPLTAGGFTIIEGWCKGCKVGRVCAFEAAIAGSRVLWCTHLAALRWTGIDGFEGRVLVRNGKAAFGSFLDAMMKIGRIGSAL